MRSKHRYVPVLKWKPGEYRALRCLDVEVAEYITPLVEVPAIPPAKEGKPPVTVAEHLKPLPQQMRQCWRGVRPSPMFVDCQAVAELLPDNTPPVVDVVRRAATHGVPLVPVTGLAAHPDHQRGIRELARDGQGVCLRVAPSELGRNPVAKLTLFLRSLPVEPAQADIILDLHSVKEPDEDGWYDDLRPVLLALSSGFACRSLTLLSGAFPTDLSRLRPGAREVPRVDWRLWRRLATLALSQTLDFGDYAIANPEARAMTASFVSPSASIRYTAEDTWVTLRGKSIIRDGSEQFHELSAALVGHASFRGPRFSWGDRYIAACAKRQDGPGNSTVWRQVGTNHHLTFVARQLATLSAA